MPLYHLFILLLLLNIHAIFNKYRICIYKFLCDNFINSFINVLFQHITISYRVYRTHYRYVTRITSRRQTTPEN